MPQATITPKYINPPKGQARSATIRDDQNGYWGIHPGDMNKYQVGVPVTVDYTQRTGQDGKTYWNITGIIRQQAPANPQAQQRQLTPRETQTLRGSQPNPQAQDEAKKSENIFITTVVQAAIQYQSYPLDLKSLTDLVANAQLAWRGFGAQMASSEPPFPGSPDDYGDVDPRG